MVAALDPLGEGDLLCGGQQLDLADVLEEELEGVGRDLAGLLDLLDRFALARDEDLDLRLFERVVDLFDVAGVEVELLEREGDFVHGQRSGFSAGLQQ